MHPQTHILIQIEGFALSATSQVPLSFKLRLLRISTPGQVCRPFHSLLTSRVSRQLQDFHLIALFRIVDSIETAIL